MDSTSSNGLGYSHQNGQPSSGLLRFRSAPSSLFLGSADTGHDDGVLSFQEFEDKSRVKEPASVNYGSPGLPPHYPRQSCSGTSSSALDSSCTYGLFGSDGNSCLSRQSSSPAGFFGSHNGYASTKGIGNYAGLNGTNGEVSPGLKHQLSFSSRVPSSFSMLSQIAEVGTEGIGPAGGTEARYFSSSGVPYDSWNAAHLEDNVNGAKRDQNGGIGDRLHLLSHHLSLPKMSPEMVAMEKFFHYQDSIPCKIRAKRGCATHPRSIAERVRRTRISERMRKLQELVPNMDKQTNTADMLDLAVDYIKDLQREYKTLSENRANCKCMSKQKPVQRQVG